MRSNLKTKIKEEAPPLILMHPTLNVPVRGSAFAAVFEQKVVGKPGKILAYIDQNPASTITKGRYKFPGGGVLVTDYNFYDCARRETIEETGLTVAAISREVFIAQVNYYGPNHQLEEIAYKVFIVCRVVDGTLKAPNGKFHERLDFTPSGRLAGISSKGCAMQEWHKSALIWAKQQYHAADWKTSLPPTVALPLTLADILAKQPWCDEVFERVRLPKISF